MSKPSFSFTSALTRITRPDGAGAQGTDIADLARPDDDDTLLLSDEAEADHDGDADGESGNANSASLVARAPRDPQGTRRMLLDAAFFEVRMAGFAGASINRILERTGATKGALYHHFPGKVRLVHAVVDECLPGYVDELWLDDLENADDVLPVLMGQVDRLGRDNAPEMLRGGCPLARLAAGADDLDENLRKRIDGVYRYWRRGLAGHIGRGQFNKTIRTDVEASSVAEFIIATLQGFLIRPPSLRNNETHAGFAREYARYLNGLRP